MSTARSMCDAVSEALAPWVSWEPQGALEMSDMLAGLGPVIDDLSNAVQAVANQLEDGPFSKTVADYTADLAAQLGKLVQEAEDSHQQFEMVHDEALERLRNPRPGAWKWDISNNP